jgi:hypothetical protein
MRRVNARVSRIAPRSSSSSSSLHSTTRVSATLHCELRRASASTTCPFWRSPARLRSFHNLKCHKHLRRQSSTAQNKGRSSGCKEDGSGSPQAGSKEAPHAVAHPPSEEMTACWQGFAVYLAANQGSVRSVPHSMRDRHTNDVGHEGPARRSSRPSRQLLSHTECGTTFP